MRLGKSENTNYIIIGVDQTNPEYINGVLWNELKSFENCEIFEGFFPLKNEFLKKMKQLHYAYIINEKFNLPLKSIWQRKSWIDDYKFEKDKQWRIIIMHSALSWFSKKRISWLNSIAKKPNVKLIHHAIDIREMTAKKFEPLQKIAREINFDLFVNYSAPTCELLKKDELWKKQRSKIIHLDSPYSKPDLPNLKTKKKLEFDLIYTAGANQMRLVWAKKVREKLKGLRLFFNISGIGNPEFKEDFSEISDCDRWISLSENIELANKAKCIFELLDLPAAYVSDRYHQAVIMNKKLLTNNPATLSFPLYNEKYVKIVRSPDQIDESIISWIKNNDEVDYGYSGEFSPQKFLESVEENLLKVRI